MEIFFWLIAAALLLQTLFAWFNLKAMPSLGGGVEGDRWLREPGSRPRLSVLIPARNEEGNIQECVRLALANDYGRLEVLVLDDRSTDGTGELARAAGARDKRLTVLEGTPLPQGWIGKTYACHQLAQRAQGEWLLFLDADARLSGGALAAAMDTALAQGSGLVTGFPRQLTGSWLERLVVPLMGFTIACHLPIRLIRSSSRASFVAAHGAFMLIDAESYRRAGGHEAIADQLVDDMELAKAVKTAGMPVTLADIAPYVSMRMYEDAAGVWNGYRKNIFPGMGRSMLLLLFITSLYTALYLLPPIAFLLTMSLGIAGMDTWELAGASAVGVAAAMLLKYVTDRKGGQPLWFALLLPAGVLALIGIAWSSWRGAASGSGYRWKERWYS